MGFTSLAYLMDLQWLTEAYHRTRKTGATGVDGQTWHEYGQNLEANLSRQPAQAAGRAAADPESENTRALRLLRNHRQQRKRVGLPPVGRAGLAKMAVPAQSRAGHDLGSLQSTAGEISLAPGGGDPFDLPSPSQSMR